MLGINVTSHDTLNLYATCVSIFYTSMFYTLMLNFLYYYHLAKSNHFLNIAHN